MSIKLTVGATLVCCGTFGLLTPAFADETTCDGLLPPGTYDNVVVPAGTTCTLIDSIVRNVKVLENARLIARDNEILGNVEGDKAEWVELSDNVIRGNVEVKEGDVPGAPPIFFTDVFICNNIFTHGNIQIEKMVGSIVIGDPDPVGPAPPVSGFACNPNQVLKGNVKVEDNTIVPFPGRPRSGLVIRGNQVAQHLTAFKNRGASTKTVAENAVVGSLQYFDNEGGFLIRANQTGQHLQVYNTRGLGLKTVQANIVTRHLQCFDNDPPFLSLLNVAEKAEGQCEP